MSVQAKRDLDGIWVFISEDNYDAADRVEDKIMSEIRGLTLHPGKTALPQ